MITKEQWTEIEKDLQGFWAHREFKLGNDKVSIAREFIKEGTSVLTVYFNGSIKGCWTHDPESENFNPLIEKFWRRRSFSRYNRKQKAILTKLYGKRRVKEKVPGIDAEYIYYQPTWPRAKTLVNHLKKIPDLELIK